MQLQEKLSFYIWFWNVTEYINIIQNKLVNIHGDILYNSRESHDTLKQLNRKMLVLCHVQGSIEPDLCPPCSPEQQYQADGTWGPITLKIPAKCKADHLEITIMCWVNESTTLVCLSMSEAKANSYFYIVVS